MCASSMKFSSLPCLECEGLAVLFRTITSLLHWFYCSHFLSMYYILGALYPAGARTFPGFHMNFFELSCTKIKSCSVWHNKQWKLAKLGKYGWKSGKGHCEEAEGGMKGMRCRVLRGPSHSCSKDRTYINESSEKEWIYIKFLEMYLMYMS